MLLKSLMGTLILEREGELLQHLRVCLNHTSYTLHTHSQHTPDTLPHTPHTLLTHFTHTLHTHSTHTPHTLHPHFTYLQHSHTKFAEAMAVPTSPAPQLTPAQGTVLQWSPVQGWPTRTWSLCSSTPQVEIPFQEYTKLHSKCLFLILFPFYSYSIPPVILGIVQGKGDNPGN